jgi:glycosyltransferase involved in cell wall biosynthesis
VTVSVVIPTKNGGEDFRRLLATIANQRGFRRVETIVVDSGSADKTVELAEQFGAKIIKILPEEFSHSYARNLGASYASGEYLLFTVQDALPPSDSWLYELFSVIKSNDVVAVSCAEFPWESVDLFYRAITWNHYRFLEVDRQDRIMRYAGSEDHLTLRKNGQLSDLACLISKDVFTKYKYKTDYGEDLDLGLRLIKDGYEIAFLGSTRIIHSHNRPAYYYLKRGYVESVFLPRIFSDYPKVGNNLDRAIPDVLFTYQVIRSMVEERTWDLQFTCKTDEFSNRIIERSFRKSPEAGRLKGER